MQQTIKSKKKGFTIIEVVLVLAIAGLIFMMVFIALPALQRSQRDTQRRNDLARFATQINQYAANNRGQVPNDAGTALAASKASDASPTAWGTFIKDYMLVGGDVFEDPDGSEYSVQDHGSLDAEKAHSAASASAMDHIIHVWHYAKCDTGKIIKTTGKRNLAYVYKLEGAGWYCGTN